MLSQSVHWYLCHLEHHMWLCEVSLSVHCGVWISYLLVVKPNDCRGVALLAGLIENQIGHVQ